jgi:hypothetical protein
MGSNSDRILATIPLPPENEHGYAVLAASQDERWLYYVGTGGRRLPSGRIFGIDAHLLIYDLSDPRHPNLASDTPLGDMTPRELADRGGRLILRSEGDADAATTNDRLTIIDSADPRRPRLRGQIDISGSNLQLTDDGDFAALTPRPGAALSSYVVDLRDPDHPVLAGLDARPGAMRPATPATIEGLEPHSLVFDRIDRLVLTQRDYSFLIWDVSEIDRPKVVQEIGAGIQSYYARLLPKRSLIVALAFGELAIVSAEKLPVSAERLRRTYDRLRAEYEADPANAAEPNWGVIGPLLAQLEDAGVRDLLSGDVAGVSTEERAQFLSGYGLWLSLTLGPERSVPILRKAVDVAPQNSEARLNLAEAARKSVARAATYADKGKLSQLALDSYAAYRQLSGQEPPGAADFAALNIAHESSADVCAYVAAFYNHGRQREVFADDGPIDIDK